MENSPDKFNNPNTDVVDVPEKNSPLSYSTFHNMIPLPFIWFSFTQTQINSNGDTTRIKVMEYHYDHGKLESKHFEGEMQMNIFNMFSQIMEKQMAIFLKSFSMFLPF
jgi:hypothetical protein